MHSSELIVKFKEGYNVLELRVDMILATERSHSIYKVYMVTRFVECFSLISYSKCLKSEKKKGKIISL